MEPVPNAVDYVIHTSVSLQTQRGPNAPFNDDDSASTDMSPQVGRGPEVLDEGDSLMDADTGLPKPEWTFSS